MQRLADALALAKARARQEFAQTGLMHGAEATRFDEADWTGLCALWRGPDLHPQQVHNLRAAAMTAPPAPPAAAQAVFAQTRIKGLEQAPPRPRPDWLPAVCYNRLRGAVFVRSIEQGDMGFAFLFATQSPFKACFIPVTVAYRNLPSLNQLSPAEVLLAWADSSDICFEFKTGSCVTHQVFGFWLLDDIKVFLNVKFCSAEMLQGYGEAMPLQQCLPVPSRKRAAPEVASVRSTGASKSARDDLVANNPWVAEYLAGSAAPPAQPAAASVDVEAQDSEEAAAFQEAWLSFEDKCAAWRLQNAPAGGTDFVTTFRSGQWNLKNRAVAESDRTIAQACPGPARQWCSQCGLNTLASFSYSRYGQETCHALALEWLCRLQHYFDIWAAQDVPHYVYTPTHLSSYNTTS